MRPTEKERGDGLDADLRSAQPAAGGQTACRRRRRSAGTAWNADLRSAQPAAGGRTACRPARWHGCHAPCSRPRGAGSPERQEPAHPRRSHRDADRLAAGCSRPDFQFRDPFERHRLPEAIALRRETKIGDEHPDRGAKARDVQVGAAGGNLDGVGLAKWRPTSGSSARSVSSPRAIPAASPGLRNVTPSDTTPQIEDGSGGGGAGVVGAGAGGRVAGVEPSEQPVSARTPAIPAVPSAVRILVGRRALTGSSHGPDERRSRRPPAPLPLRPVPSATGRGTPRRRPRRPVRSCRGRSGG